MKKLPAKNVINLNGVGVSLSNQFVDKWTQESFIFKGFTISQYLDFSLFVLAKLEQGKINNEVTFKKLLVEYAEIDPSSIINDELETLTTNTEPQQQSNKPLDLATPAPQRIEKNTRDQFSVEELYQIDRDRIKPEDKMDFAKERLRRKEEAESATPRLTPDLTQIKIQNNPGVDSVTIQTDNSQSRTIYKFPNENRDIKRVYNPSTCIREDVTWIRELHTEQGKKSYQPAEIIVSDSTEDDYHLLHRPSRDQSPGLILLGLYQHTPNVNQFAIVAVNMETMKFYDSLKVGTNSTMSQQYLAYNDIISLPIEEAMELINSISALSSSPHLAFDYTSRSNEFSGWNLDPDTPYMFRLPTPDELVIEFSNDKYLIYNKRVHPITGEPTNGHVLIEGEEKYIHPLLTKITGEAVAPWGIYEF